MWTLETRVELTPIGAYVTRLARADRRLDGWTFPGLHSTDARTQKAARETVETVDALRGAVREELARFGAVPLGPVEESGHADPETFPAPSFGTPELDALQAARICSCVCPQCGIGNVHGQPSCSDRACPKRREPKVSDLADFPPDYDGPGTPAYDRAANDRTICDCGQPTTEVYMGRMFCAKCAAEIAAEDDRRSSASCPTCDGSGRIPVGYGGNCELTTNCPDCTPVYA